MSQVQTTKPTILVVDDEISNLEILYEILKDDYAVAGIPNPRVVLDVLNHQALPELILLDVNMPEVSGYDLCKKIKADKRTQDIPIIFITANDKEKDEIFGFEIGAADYITKPFRPSVVKARIKTHTLLKQKNELLKNKIVELEKSIRIFENKAMRPSAVKELMSENPKVPLGGDEYKKMFLDDHILDFEELEDIIDSRVSLMCMRNALTHEHIGESAHAIRRYGNILVLYPIFIALGEGLREFATKFAEIELDLPAQKIKMALGCLETLSFTLLHWRQQLFSGALTNPNAYDDSLLSDIKTILNLIDINYSDDSEEMELF